MEFEATLTRTSYAKLLIALLAKQRTMLFVGLLFVAILVFSVILKLPAYLSIVYIAGVIGAYGISILNAVRSPRNRRYFVPRKYEFSGKGITITTANIPQDMKWSSFTDVNKFADFYILFVTKHTFIAIPRRSIPFDEVSVFEAMLYKNIVRAKEKRKRGMG